MFQVLLPIGSDEDRAISAAETVISLPNADESVQVLILNVENKIQAVDSGGDASSEDWYDETDFPSSCIQAKEYLENTDVAVKMRREHAEPENAIIEVANEIDADRIILCARKRTPTGKIIFRSITQSVLLNSDVPTTVIME